MHSFYTIHGYPSATSTNRDRHKAWRFGINNCSADFRILLTTDLLFRPDPQMPSTHDMFTSPGVKDSIHQKAEAPQHVSVLVCPAEIHSPETNTLSAAPSQQMGALPHYLN